MPLQQTIHNESLRAFSLLFAGERKQSPTNHSQPPEAATEQPAEGAERRASRQRRPSGFIQCFPSVSPRCQRFVPGRLGVPLPLLWRIVAGFPPAENGAPEHRLRRLFGDGPQPHARLARGLGPLLGVAPLAGAHQVRPRVEATCGRRGSAQFFAVAASLGGCCVERGRAGRTWA